jgi:hypothetical protein
VGKFVGATRAEHVGKFVGAMRAEHVGFLEKFPSLTTEILKLTAVAFNVRCGRPSKKAQVDPQKKQEEIAAKNTQPC